MKRTLSLILATLLVVATMVFTPIVSNASTVADCTKTFYAGDYNYLQQLLENANSDMTVKLRSSVICEDNTVDYNIDIKGNYTVILDFNGYSINVNSNSTKSLFTVKDGADFRLINSAEITTPEVSMNLSSYDDSSVVTVDSKRASFTNYNAHLSLNSEMGNTSCVDCDKDSQVIYVCSADNINILGGKLTNYFKNGDGIFSGSNAFVNNYVIAGNVEITAEHVPVNLNGKHLINTLKIYDAKLNRPTGADNTFPLVRFYDDSTVTFKNICGKSMTDPANIAVPSLDGSEINYTKPIAEIKNGELSFATKWDKSFTYGDILLESEHISLSESTGAFYSILSHTFETTSEAQEPDCTTDGCTEGKICTACGYEVKPVTLKAQGHTYEPEHCGSVTKIATPTSVGYFSNTCIECGYIDKTIIACPSTIKFDKKQYTYTGKAVSPKLTVYDFNGDVISPDHYKISYGKGRKNVGEYKVTVKFITPTDNDYLQKTYSGSLSGKFKIVPKSTKITKFSGKKGQIKLTWKKQSANNASGYIVKYSDNDDHTSKAKTVTVKNSKTTSYTIKKLTSTHNYLISVATYKTVNNKKYISNYSPTKYVYCP